MSLYFRRFKYLFYTDEHLKWDKPPKAVCLLIDLSVTLPLKIEWNARWASHFKSSRV